MDKKKNEALEAWCEKLLPIDSAEDAQKILESYLSVMMHEGEPAKVWHALAAAALAISGYPPEVLNMTMEEYDTFCASEEGEKFESEIKEVSAEKLDSLFSDLGIEDEE